MAVQQKKPKTVPPEPSSLGFTGLNTTKLFLRPIRFVIFALNVGNFS